MAAMFVKITPIVFGEVGHPVWIRTDTICLIDPFSADSQGHSRLSLQAGAPYWAASVNNETENTLYAVETDDEIAHMINHSCDIDTAREHFAERERQRKALAELNEHIRVNRERVSRAEYVNIAKKPIKWGD